MNRFRLTFLAYLIVFVALLLIPFEERLLILLIEIMIFGGIYLIGYYLNKSNNIKMLREISSLGKTMDDEEGKEFLVSYYHYSTLSMGVGLVYAIVSYFFNLYYLIDICVLISLVSVLMVLSYLKANQLKNKKQGRKKL